MKIEANLKKVKSLFEENISQSEKDRKEAGRFQHRATTRIDGKFIEKSREKLLSWVGVVSTDYELDDVFRGTHTGTCTWIRSTQAFLNWFGLPDVATEISSPVLWLHGGPGIGKTHLASSIIKYLQEHSSYPTAFFVCNHSYEEKRKTTSILRSWVYQLMQQSKTAL
ncbi:hypothetical protein DFP73DRAFT_614699 [Morchella snyderi]|nr:hypothetical protein DFP73DRAFT_614699 [Morchella snyderi]